MFLVVRGGGDIALETAELVVLSAIGGAHLAQADLGQDALPGRRRLGERDTKQR